MEDNLTEEMPIKDAIKWVADHLRNEWREVGRHLGLSEADIQHINSDYYGNAKEINYQMLLKWVEMNGNGATVSILVDALQTLKRNDIAHKLIEEKHPNKKQADSKDVKAHKKKRNQLKQQNKEQVHSKDAKKHKKTLDAERQKSNKTFGQVFRLCLVLVPATVVCISFYLRPNIVMQMMNGTLSLLEGARRIEESWQKLSAGSGQHNLVMGKCDSGDQLLYEEKIRKGHSLLPIFYQMHTFTYNCKTNEYITCVVVEDGWDDDTGGDPELVKGGPGKRYVEIKVTSMIGRGMDFSFYVYGRK